MACAAGANVCATPSSASPSTTNNLLELCACAGGAAAAIFVAGAAAANLLACAAGDFGRNAVACAAAAAAADHHHAATCSTERTCSPAAIRHAAAGCTTGCTTGCTRGFADTCVTRRATATGGTTSAGGTKLHPGGTIGGTTSYRIEIEDAGRDATLATGLAKAKRLERLGLSELFDLSMC